MTSTSGEPASGTKPFLRNKLRRLRRGFLEQRKAANGVCSQWYLGPSGKQFEERQTGRVLWYCGSKTLGRGKLVPWPKLRWPTALRPLAAIRFWAIRANLWLAKRLEVSSYEGLHGECESKGG